VSDPGGGVIPRPQNAIGAVLEIVVIVVAAIALALGIQALAVKPYQIPSGSMEPTLDIGQRILVNRLSHHLGSDPSVGDVVVFHPPSSATASGPKCTVPHEEGQPCPMNGTSEADDNFIKRVVAGPGDTLEIDNGIPIVNGKPVEGDWTIRPCRQATGGLGCNFRNPITIPPDHYFMMGDNRGHSDDSRFWGPVPRDWIVGQAVLTYWPPDRIGTL
jgi:signal peptidase I